MARDIYKSHPEANFLQTDEWAKVARKLGHKVIVKEFSENSSALMIVKDAKRGRYLEIPAGPLIDWSNRDTVRDTFKEIYKIAKQNKCVFVRFRPQLIKNPENIEIINDLEDTRKFNIRPASFHLHAQNTVILDLQKSEDELLANMRRQTRYEVRRAEKLELKVEKGNSEELFDEFHECQVDTARRQNFIPPSKKDLIAYRDVFGKKVIIYTVKTTKTITADGKKIAEEESEDDIPANSVIAYGLFIKSGEEVDYFEAASTPVNRLLPGAHLLQWEAMKDFKKEGYKRYNLWGIAPAGQPNHRYAGVTTFKTGFGGENVDYIPAQDLIVKPFRYKITLLIETIRKKVRHLS